MLAAVVEKAGELRVREVPVPRIDETECLVKILACALCNGTDRKILDGHFRYQGPASYPGILGHESVGRVVECGSRVESFVEGDLVLRPGARYDQGEDAGLSCLYGGLAQVGKIKDPVHGGSPMHQVIPPDMDPVDATMLITLKETLSWLQRWPVEPGQSVAVLGSGPVGVSFAFFARLLGCHPVILVGRRDEPLSRALRLGVDAVVNTQRDDPVEAVRHWTGGRGVDRVIEAVGVQGRPQAELERRETHRGQRPHLHGDGRHAPVSAGAGVERCPDDLFREGKFMHGGGPGTEVSL